MIQSYGSQGGTPVPGISLRVGIQPDVPVLRERVLARAD